MLPKVALRLCIELGGLPYELSDRRFAVLCFRSQNAIYKCPVPDCEETFTSPLRRRKHLGTHTGANVPYYTCDVPVGRLCSSVGHNPSVFTAQHRTRVPTRTASRLLDEPKVYASRTVHV